MPALVASPELGSRGTPERRRVASVRLARITLDNPAVLDLSAAVQRSSSAFANSAGDVCADAWIASRTMSGSVFANMLVPRSQHFSPFREDRSLTVAARF